MTMVKRRNLLTRALGAEPLVPDIAALAGWVQERRAEGEGGDLTSFLLGQSLQPQISAGISFPCAGGKFCLDRLLASFTGVEERVFVGETGLDGSDLAADAGAVSRINRNAWCALPAPHLLGIADAYFGDADEAASALAALYRAAMRAMRDAGVAGHVLICDRADEGELPALASQKVFFFHPAPESRDLESLLEYQDRVAVSPDSLTALFDLSGEYDIAQLIIMDHDAESIALALSRLDPEQVVSGGYCTGSPETYWDDVVAKAFYTA